MNPKQTYVDSDGNYYLVCEPVIEGYGKLFIVNLTEATCTLLAKSRLKDFLAGMKLVDLDVKERVWK